jgi:glycosyltransferase involved in cell wall biosynthesis
MKVLYLVPQSKRVGRLAAYTFLDEEIQALAAAGVQAYVLSTVEPADTWTGNVRVISYAARTSMPQRMGAAAFLARWASSASARHFGHPMMWYRSARREYLAAQVVEAEGIDLIHSHFAWPTGFGGMLARAETGRPLVASLRGTDILIDAGIGYGRRRKLVFDRALRGLLQRADRTVYFSNYMRDHAVSLGALPPATRVIRKGVDLAHFAPVENRAALKRELGIGDRPMVLTVGGLIRRKGIDQVLNAVSRLRARHDFTCVICGDGPERARLEALSVRLGLGDRTMFTGRVDRQTIPKYFAACDVFALASTVEAAGNVLFEAMASARPVVCTNAGGPQEYVADGQTGYIVPVGDAYALATRIGQLLDQPALADALGHEGRRRTVGQFTYERMVADLMGVYEDVLRPGARARLAG